MSWYEPMEDEVSHLSAGAAALLCETDERRIRAIQSRRWVLYPRAKQALDRLSWLLDHPRGRRMPSVAIYGDSSMGKTMIMTRFHDALPAQTPSELQSGDGHAEDPSPCHGNDEPAW